ncbi:hypothetical protein JL720_4112 [Aureococcus anophagefferens]|nr:hypothetical protein JL720_4112 [Aureococcus anophagefferens]
MLDSAAVQALRDIKSLFDEGILTEEEYTDMKAEILTGARSPEPAAVHVGVTCDDCGMSPIRGVRFKCTVFCVAVLPDGRVVSGSDDKSLIVWDPTDGSSFPPLIGHSSSARLRRPAAPSPSEAEPWIVNCLVVLPDGRVVSGSHDNSLKITRKYLKEPRLRLLCGRGRATPLADPALARLFGVPDESTRAIPKEVFWHVLAYWRSSRDDE